MNPITTARLELVPAGLDLLDAELASPAELGRLLYAVVPAGWPPGDYDRSAMESFRDRLSADPGAAGWYGWYALHRAGDGPRTIIGAAGFLGPPSADGTVEVGYSIVEAYRRQGFATEIVLALVRHAWLAPQVRRVIAHTDADNVASAAILERCGFTRVDPSGQTGLVEYIQARPAE